MKILEIQARDILSTYEGANNQLLEWKQKFNEVKNFKLTRPQSKYVLDNKDVVPKVARKYLKIFPTFAEKIQEEKRLVLPPEKIWCEKLLCETDKAYHIWGKVTEKENMYAFWLPKGVIILEEKKLKYEIDYSKFDKPDRPVMAHQKVAVEKLIPNDRFILADDMGLGKGLNINTLVYTPTGTIKIGDLNVGEKVIGSDGLPYNVIGVFPQGLMETYKITFNDGVTIITDENHLWSVSSPNYSKNRKNDRIKKSLVLSTKQMYEGGKIKIKGVGYNQGKNYDIETFYKSPNGNNKWQIPIVKPIIFENNYSLPIDPYLLGLGLGDGSFKGENIRFSVHKDDFDEMFSHYNIKENKPEQNKRNGYVNVGNSLFDLEIEHTRSQTKFIPELYKYTSIEDRLSLLQGLMDTDGYCMKSETNKFNGTFYTTVSEKLCNDVIEIVQSLGGIARKSSKIPKFTYKEKKIEGKRAFQINIKLPLGMNPFRLSRKSNNYHTPQKYPTGRYIKNIEKEGTGETVCISVDSPDKLYVAEHGIVTHNTTSAIIAAIESGAKKILIVCPASLKINWKREIEMYTNRRTLIVEGGKWGSTFDFYIINYDIIKNYHSLPDEKTGQQDSLILKEHFDLAIVDECFTYNSKITTDKGDMLIGDIVENGIDVKILSYNYNTKKTEYKKIVRWIRKNKDTLLKIKLQNGTFIECTEDHKFFTKKRGYVKARELKYDDDLFMLSETINKKTNNEKEQILFPQLFNDNKQQIKSEKRNRKKIYKILSSLWKKNDVYNGKKNEQEHNVLIELSREEKYEQQNNKRKTKKNNRKKWWMVQSYEKSLRYEFENENKIIGKNENKQSYVQSIECGKNEAKTNRPNIFIKRRPWSINRTTENFTSTFRRRLGTRISCFNQRCKPFIQMFTASIPSGYWKQEVENFNRNRWKNTQIKEMEIFRQEKNRSIEFIRVESIEILERGSYDESTTMPSKNTRVYDLEIEDNHNYFINNILVSNCHMINNTGAMRTQLMNDILDTIPKVWLLTGTPMTSRPINYYNLLKIVKSPLTLNWQGYVKRYCKGFQFTVNGRKIWKTDGAANLDELRERTRHVILRRLKTDVLDLPEKIISPMFLELDNMLYEHEMEEFVKITSADRKKESISITLSRLMAARKLIAREKVPYTCELIDKFLELDKKVIVFTNFTDTLEMIKEKYSKNCVVVNGSTSKMKRQEAVDRFQTDPKIKVFIGNIIAAGVGLTLTAAEGVIMNDLSFVPSHHSQAEDRANRIGQKNSVIVYYPIFEDTIEINIYNILQKKKNNIDQVMGDGEYSESFAKEFLREIL